MFGFLASCPNQLNSENVLTGKPAEYHVYLFTSLFPPVNTLKSWLPWQHQTLIAVFQALWDYQKLPNIIYFIAVAKDSKPICWNLELANALRCK